MKIRPTGAEVFHADRQTDVTKQTAAFCAILQVCLKLHPLEKKRQLCFH